MDSLAELFERHRELLYAVVVIVILALLSGGLLGLLSLVAISAGAGLAWWIHGDHDG